MSSKKKISIPVIIVICVAAVVFLYFKFFRGGSSGNPVYVQSVRAVSASAGSLQNRFGGVVETQKTEKVEFDSSMILAEVYVKEGDRVEEGDPLFTVHAHDEATLAYARLRLHAAHRISDAPVDRLPQFYGIVE